VAIDLGSIIIGKPKKRERVAVREKWLAAQGVAGTLQLVFEYVERHITAHGVAPFQKKIAEALGISQPTVNAHLRRLETMGFIERVKRRAGRMGTRHGGLRLTPFALAADGDYPWSQERITSPRDLPTDIGNWRPYYECALVRLEAQTGRTLAELHALLKEDVRRGVALGLNARLERQVSLEARLREEIKRLKDSEESKRSKPHVPFNPFLKRTIDPNTLSYDI